MAGIARGPLEVELVAPAITLEPCRRHRHDHGTIGLVTPPYAAELRVYEPLAAFDVEERRRWQQYAQSPAVPSAREGSRRERVLGLRAACRATPAVPRPGEAGEHAAVLRGESGLLVCPWRTELRCWEAATESRVALPPEVARIALPDHEVDLASAEHQRWLAEHPTRRSHVQQTGGWCRCAGSCSSTGRSGGCSSRPARWSDPHRPMAQARRRVARGLHALRKALTEGPAVGSVEALGRWLEEFHPRSLVELDYGGLVGPAAGTTSCARTTRPGTSRRRSRPLPAATPRRRPRRTTG